MNNKKNVHFFMQVMQDIRIMDHNKWWCYFKGKTFLATGQYILTILYTIEEKYASFVIEIYGRPLFNNVLHLKIENIKIERKEKIEISNVDVIL